MSVRLGMFKLVKVMVVSVTLTMGWVNGSVAASFDCNKASTETEVAICSDPELSKFDETLAAEYQRVDPSSEFSNYIRTDHFKWLKAERDASIYNLQAQFYKLKYLNSFENCSFSKQLPLDNCIRILDEQMSTCMEKNNWTTWAMNLCGFSLARSYRVIVKFMTDKKVEALASDHETIDLLKSSQKLWLDFIDVECQRQWSEYREGTMRGQIQSGCLLYHYEQRIKVIAREIE